jgi:hypothetical protein
VLFSELYVYKHTRSVVYIYIDLPCDIYIYYVRAIRKVTSGGLLTKQATRKNYYIQKYAHTYATSRRTHYWNWALVVSGNEFLYACVKEARRL